MKYIGKILGLVAVSSIGISNSMQALDSNGTGIGSISTEVNIALCTAIGGQATIEQGAFKETNNISSESATSDKKLDISVSGGQSACGDQVAGTYNPKTEKAKGSAAKATSFRSASVSPKSSTRSSSKRSVGDINQLSKAKFMSLLKNAPEITSDGISTTLPAANDFKVFTIGPTNTVNTAGYDVEVSGTKLIVKTSQGYANKYTIAFYLEKPSVGSKSIELLEIANVTLKGVTQNINSVNMFLQAGQDGTVGLRIMGIEQLLPTNVPLENFAAFHASRN